MNELEKLVSELQTLHDNIASALVQLQDSLQQDSMCILDGYTCGLDRAIMIARSMIENRGENENQHENGEI